MISLCQTHLPCFSGYRSPCSLYTTMDPLSVSASIAGLVTLADLVFRSTSNYVRSARGSDKEVAALLQEIRNLSVILHNLSLVAFDLEAEQTHGPATAEDAISIKHHHLHDCQQVLRQLEQGLEDKQSKMTSHSTRVKLQSRHTWPFSSAKTKELLEGLRRHKGTLELALAADSLNKLRLCLSRQDEVHDRVKDIQSTAGKLLDIQTRIAIDKKKSEVLKFFLRTNPRDEYETNIKLHHPMTGLWLTEGPEFDEWYTTHNSSIWCTGIPGAGKSVLAACIVEECLRRSAGDPSTAVAYFFCTYRNIKTHAASSILSSLCAQLALQNDNAFAILEDYYDELKPLFQPARDRSDDRLASTFCKMSEAFHQVYLIVDGLDECSDHVQDSTHALVALRCPTGETSLKMALSSRDEIIIRQEIRPCFQHIEIEAHTADLQLYVAAELESRIASRKLRLRDLTLKDVLMARLVDGAKGMYVIQAVVTLRWFT